jgi:hypothetical protein
MFVDQYMGATGRKEIQIRDSSCVGCRSWHGKKKQRTWKLGLDFTLDWKKTGVKCALLSVKQFSTPSSKQGTPLLKELTLLSPAALWTRLPLPVWSGFLPRESSRFLVTLDRDLNTASHQHQHCRGTCVIQITPIVISSV